MTRAPISTYWIHQDYSLKHIEYIWNEFRDVVYYYKIGRKNLKEFVEETISYRSNSVSVLLTDGSEYVGIKSPSSKTLTNFLKSRKYTVQFLNSNNNHSHRFGAGPRTLQYVHLFLWCHDEEKVNTWEKEIENEVEHGQIDNVFYGLNTTSPLVNPSFIFEKAIKLLFREDRNAAEEFYGVLYFKKGARDNECNYNFFNKDQWNVITSEFGDNIKRSAISHYSEENQISYGIAQGVRDITINTPHLHSGIKSKYSPPFLDNERIIIVCKNINQSSDLRFEYIILNVSELLLSKQRFFDAEYNEYCALPPPIILEMYRFKKSVYGVCLNDNEQILIEKVCKLIK
jgi:hypothetical protein